MAAVCKVTRCVLSCRGRGTPHSGGSGGIGISKPYDTIVERENQGRRTVFVFYLFLIFILAVLVCAYCFVSVCLFSCLQGLQFVGGSSNNTGAG